MRLSYLDHSSHNRRLLDQSLPSSQSIEFVSHVAHISMQALNELYYHCTHSFNLYYHSHPHISLSTRLSPTFCWFFKAGFFNLFLISFLSIFSHRSNHHMSPVLIIIPSGIQYSSYLNFFGPPLCFSFFEGAWTFFCAFPLSINLHLPLNTLNNGWQYQDNLFSVVHYFFPYEAPTAFYTQGY